MKTLFPLFFLILFPLAQAQTQIKNNQGTVVEERETFGVWPDRYNVTRVKKYWDNGQLRSISQTYSGDPKLTPDNRAEVEALFLARDFRPPGELIDLQKLSPYFKGVAQVRALNMTEDGLLVNVNLAAPVEITLGGQDIKIQDQVEFYPDQTLKKINLARPGGKIRFESGLIQVMGIVEFSADGRPMELKVSPWADFENTDPQKGSLYALNYEDQYSVSFWPNGALKKVQPTEKGRDYRRDNFVRIHGKNLKPSSNNYVSFHVNGQLEQIFFDYYLGEYIRVLGTEVAVTQATFWDNGRLRSFSPGRKVVSILASLQGESVEVMANEYLTLSASGKITSAQLAEWEYLETTQGTSKLFSSGDCLVFDENQRVQLQ